MFTWEIELRIERSRRMKISFGLKLVSDSCTNYLIFRRFWHLYTLKYVNKTSHFANNLYFSHNERRFHSEFHSRVEFRFKFTWFLIDISFRIECSIRNKNGMNSIRNELQLNPDSCKHANILQSPMISTDLKRNEFDSDWNSIRIHVNTPLIP